MKGKVIGDILLLKKDVENPQELLKIYGVNKIVKLGSIEGLQRKPNVQMIWGEGTETIHKENKCLFKIDVSEVMWSKGNSAERMRMAEIAKDKETIVDMFAGIGYFSIPLAIHSPVEKIYSVEINPTSYYYLKENIALNRVENIIEPILGNCLDFSPPKNVDRVLMGYIGNTHEYLDVALEILRDGGVIHYHEAVPEKLMFTRPVERIKSAANGHKVEILNQKAIKKFSPGVYHVVIDARIGN
ncbi:MAG TPA: class I SAM-dependent methyltransferase family protein [Methanobacteriaceae archaeon]|nr:class I SAM-dependent methyltransferase family protein [Methanobacteriaceae archaeon]